MFPFYDFANDCANVSVLLSKFFQLGNTESGTKYSRMDQVKFLKAVIQKFYLVHS